LHLTLLCQLAEEGRDGCVDDGGGGGSGKSGRSDEQKRQAWRNGN